MWATHRSLLLRLPWRTWVFPGKDSVWTWHDCLDCGGPDSNRCTRKPVAMGARDPALVGAFPSTWWLMWEGQPWWGLFLTPGRAGGQCVGKETLQWQLHPLCITQQWHLASMAVWVSSTSILSCRFPPSHLHRLSPHSQQQSSARVCSPIPMFQLSAPVWTSGHASQSGACRAVARTIRVGLTLSSLPQTSHFILLWQLQMLPICPNWLPRQWGGFLGYRKLSSASALPQGCRSHPASSPLLFPFFLSSYPVMWGSFLSFLESKVFC